MPRVIARIHDPRRAALYEELGIVTVSDTDWALRKIRDHLEHRALKEEHAFGRGEVSLLRLELPSTWSTARWPTSRARGCGWSASPAGAARSCGDACEPSVLDRLGLDTVDTVVAATGDDEDNLVVSLLVKRWYGVPRVVARVNNPKNTWLFTADWGSTPPSPPRR